MTCSFAADRRLRAAGSDVRLVHEETNARAAVALDDVARAIGGGIDDDEQLEVGEGLSQNGVDRGGRNGSSLYVANRTVMRGATAATLERRSRAGNRIAAVSPIDRGILHSSQHEILESSHAHRRN